LENNGETAVKAILAPIMDDLHEIKTELRRLETNLDKLKANLDIGFDKLETIL
jgi:hypothetical protein